ncbi:DUF7504 family protein [Halalkalicoccus jeotgali]|nr:hypothetical protein [Halalkalicoccus jeotgali]ELY35194.1 hypothetical protein C497_13448 [Halalkalicoccus jeotgali B3]
MTTHEARNDLVLAPKTSPVEDIERVLVQGEFTEEWNVLVVAYGWDHRSLKKTWHDRIEERPAAFGAISVGTGSDSSSGAAPISRSGCDITAAVRNPTDLAELGTTISLFLDDWTEGTTLVCFHSLECLIDRVGSRAAFRFLHVLTRRLAGIDAISQFSLDPSATDDRIVRTLEPLFDSVHEPEDPTPTITPETAFDVLRDSRRQHVLRYIYERDGSVPLSALVKRIAHHEPDADADRIEISMHHSHLPKLEDAGLISVGETHVTGCPAIEALEPHLELVADHDRPD